MPHPESEHGLRVQLATALKERDEARALAEKWAQREAALVDRGMRADADALSEVQWLQATVERLRGDLVKYGSHVDGCSGDDFCSCGLEVARLQAARADAAEVAHDSCAAYAHELSEALAAARRETEERNETIARLDSDLSDAMIVARRTVEQANADRDAARRECEFARGWARIWKSVAKHSTTELRELTYLMEAGTWPDPKALAAPAAAAGEEK